MSTWQRWKNIQKCYPFEEKRLNKWQPPYIVNIKYDGDRCWRDPLSNGHSLLLSSEENPFLMLPHIQEAVNALPHKLKLDGELYDHNLYLEGDHGLIHGIASRTVNIHPRYKELGFYIFDIKDPTKTQIERQQILNELELKPPLFKAPYWMCNSLSEVKFVYNDVISRKYEGIIIRNLWACYEDNKRSTWIMKFKPKRKDKYKIVGWKEEISMDGIPKGRIGSLIMSSQSGDEFAVSAGLNDADKEYLWGVRGLISGSMATIHYQHLTNKQIPKGTFDIEIPDWGIG